MKIVKVDNFDRDYISDVLIADNVNVPYEEFLTKALNESYSSKTSPNYFRLVADDYKLKKWEP